MKARAIDDKGNIYAEFDNLSTKDRIAIPPGHSIISGDLLYKIGTAVQVDIEKESTEEAKAAAEKLVLETKLKLVATTISAEEPKEEEPIKLKSVRKK